jgi:hypothetical protein
MKPASEEPERKGRESAADATSDTAAATRNTPSTDMQPEDAGTAASGAAGRSTVAESAMKQTSKTSNEKGSGR